MYFISKNGFQWSINAYLLINPFFITDNFPCFEVCSGWNIAPPAFFWLMLELHIFLSLFTFNLYVYIFKVDFLKMTYMGPVSYLLWKFFNFAFKPLIFKVIIDIGGLISTYLLLSYSLPCSLFLFVFLLCF